MEQKIEISKSDYALDILARFDHFRKTNKHCDFIIRAGNKEMHVHRFVVSASSEYFDAMLSHDTKENNDGVVVMKEVDPDCVVKCVDFMYTGEASVAKEKQQDLMHVAHMLQLKRLYNGIAVFLEEKLDCSSFFSTREIAKLYNCEKLAENCNEFAFKNFRALAKLEDFGRLDVNFVDFLLSSKDLKESDAIKCKALMLWINYDSGRAASLFDLMKHVNFNRIPMSYRRFLTEHEPAISNSLECLKYVMKSVFDSGNSKAADISLDGNSGIIVLDSQSGRIKCFDLNEKKWNDMQEMHQNLRNNYCSVVILDEHIYVLTALTTFRLYYKDPNASWEQLASRKGPYWGDAVVMNGLIYATCTNRPSNHMERFDPNTNNWSFIPDRSVILAYSAVAVAGNISDSSQSENLFLLGGLEIDSGHETNVVQQFDPTSSSWSKAPSLRQGRWSASATTLAGAIYLFGGRQQSGYLQSVEVLSRHTSTWQIFTMSNFTRSNFTSCVIDGKIYLVGNDNSKFRTIDEYDPNSRTLETVVTLTDMSVRYFSSAAAVV